MTDTVSYRGPVYAYSLISWSAVIAGSVVAIAVGAALNLLGVAIGATAFNPFDFTHGQAKAITIGGGLWIAFANLVALQIGAFIAARTSRWPDHVNGLYQGLAVWAVCFVIAMAGVGAGVGGAFKPQPGPGYERGHRAAVASAERAAADQALGPDGGPIARSYAVAEDADAAAKATAALAWWGVLSLVLGLVGAVAGGRLGARHPLWNDRPRGLNSF